MAFVLALVALSGCALSGTAASPARTRPSSIKSSSAPGHAPVSSVPSTTIAPTTTVASPPSFVGTVSAVTAAQLPYSYHPGCPVDPSQLRLLTMSYWGFDNQPHTGSMVVNASVTQAVLQVFAQLYDERFPIRQMVPIDAYQGNDEASTAADNTAGFNCRLAVAPGPPQWSVHAYGEAIDVNPLENPYVDGGTVEPPAGSAYLDRSDVRPGMAEPGGELNNAFASVGWQWGGRWTASPDYQHFSATGG